MSRLPGAPALAAGHTFETARLRLRLFVEPDLEALAAMYGDPETMRHIGNGQVLTRADSWRAIAGMPGHWALRG